MICFKVMILITIKWGKKILEKKINVIQKVMMLTMIFSINDLL